MLFCPFDLSLFDIFVLVSIVAMCVLSLSYFLVLPILGLGLRDKAVLLVDKTIQFPSPPRPPG